MYNELICSSSSNGNKENDMEYTITAQNVSNESFYNLCKLVDALGYANPISAIKELNIQVTVEKDECGNVVKVK